jgi:hypothetical protein
MPEDPTTCTFDANDSCCTKCVRTQFCELNNNCFAAPANICGGTTSEDSEILTFIDCMYSTEGGAAPGTGDDSDFERCIGEAAEVSAMYCGLGTISGPTNELAVAIVGSDDDAGCFFECLDNTFDEETEVCLYDE